MSKRILRRATKIILISCNILVALLLLAGCYGSWFDPQKFWYIGLLTLATLYFLLILIGFIVFWFFAKRALTLISIVAIVFAWKPIREVIAMRFASDFSKKKDPANLRMMTWNVEHFDILEHRSHPEKKQEMFALIREYHPDIACFQEMVVGDRSPNAINYLPDFIEKLDMNEYHYSFNPKLDFDNNHHFGIIIFSKYPIINKQTIAYPPYDYNSTFQYADIVKDADTFRIFNVHLQSLKFSHQNRKYIDDPSMKDEYDIEESKSVIAKLRVGFLKHKIQSERIKQAIDQSPYPVVVCGDFIDVPNSYAYKTIGAGLRNAFTEKGSGIGRTFYSISPTLRIDNIFTDKRFTIDQYVRVKKVLSDHFPLVADLRLEKSEK